jgi:hypothetical protein
MVVYLPPLCASRPPAEILTISDMTGCVMSGWGTGGELRSQQAPRSQALVAHACNPSYLGGKDWENHDLGK